MSQLIQVAAIVLAVSYPLYVLVRAKGGRSNAVLALALWTTAALMLTTFMMRGSEGFGLYGKALLMLEAALCPVWLTFSLVYSRGASLANVSTTQRLIWVFSFIPLGIAAWFPVRSFFYSPDFILDKMLFLEPLAFFFYLQIMLLLAVSLFNLEATLANAPHGVKWKIKFSIVGSGTIVAAHILYFSQSLLFRAMDMRFTTLLAVSTVLGVGLIAYSHVSRGGEERVVISRSLAYRSFVALFGAVFILCVGLFGEAMKLFGESVNSYLLIMLLFVASLFLVVLALSEKMRRKLRLSIQRNFYGEKYDYRLEWRKFTERTTSARNPDELYRGILRGFCETFGVVGACLYLQGRHDTNYGPVLYHEMDHHGSPISVTSGLIEHLGRHRDIIDMRAGDYSFDEETDRLLKSREVRFVVPIHSRDNLLGVIMLGRAINQIEPYDEEDLELMQAFANQTSAVIRNLRLGDELAESRNMEAFGQVATFVLHDLKNQVYPLSLLVDNARKYIDDPEFQKDMLDSLTNITGRMNELIAQLTHIPGKNQLRLEPVDLMELAHETARLLPDANIEFVGDTATAMVDREEIRKVTLNLFMNAIEANNGDRFKVRVANDGGPKIEVIDFGHGIDEAIMREGLFVPFKTTKHKGMGIGLYQSKQIVEAHGGIISATSVSGKGSTFSVSFPRMPQEGTA
ncbi:XrtA/PEP-CTERM system histidine kinase PrsK [Salidesulfovibrio brasiliensis]|uniref:XrtA/PEP-CTERM system histidine kinase PrsK n=1 Tax=Salidesulfovibrio brasiliensis TaxID=221711 RepID=UPI0006CF36CE|nr:XrtA/PEP-CTERM system histidine kinase PrsK [Salidesulfovibrio brasiliensis]